MCKFAFVTHWNCQGREDTFPHPPPESGPFRASSPNPRSESAGGAGRSPDGNLPRRRGQNWESGDAGGGSVFNLDPEVVAGASGRNLPQPDEGQTAEFTLVKAKNHFANACWKEDTAPNNACTCPPFVGRRVLSS